MENKAKRNKIIFTGIIIFLILILLLYKIGFRITDNYTIGKVGYLNVNTPLENTSIIIDQETKILGTKQSEKIELSPRTHEVIISRDGYFPWIKKVQIKSKNTLTINPLFVSQNASGQIITQNDGEYWKIKNLIEKDVLPKKENAVVGSDGKTKAWVENDVVLVQNNKGIQTVIEPLTPVKNLSFYKDRNDVLIFSTGNSVYAIETDTDNDQNFYPIYKGTDPRFVVATTSALYVLDGDLLMEVVI